jgi:hypothetical protein
MLTLTPAFVLGIVLFVGSRVKQWSLVPMVLAMMLAFSLSAASPVRPAIDSLNQAFVNLMNNIGGGNGLV